MESAYLKEIAEAARIQSLLADKTVILLQIIRLNMVNGKPTGKNNKVESVVELDRVKSVAYDTGKSAFPAWHNGKRINQTIINLENGRRLLVGREQ